MSAGGSARQNRVGDDDGAAETRGERQLIPSEIEEYRDRSWQRENTATVETAADAERFIERAGFAACLTDSRTTGPSWVLKDEVMRRGKVYYGKLARGRALFIAPRMIPHFHAVWGLRKSDEQKQLSKSAQAILRVLRHEWEMATSDLRAESGVKDRARFTRGMDELQAAMIVVPSEVVYRPKFTYIWTLAVGRFPDQLQPRVKREAAVREIARCFLTGAGMTFPGEMARVAGLNRSEAGLGNRALVTEGFATMPSRGVYRLTTLGPAQAFSRRT